MSFDKEKVYDTIINILEHGSIAEIKVENECLLIVGVSTKRKVMLKEKLED